MTVAALCTEAAVREVLDLNSAASSKYSSQLIGSNIRSASTLLERLTHRILRDEPDLQLKFTTNGSARVVIPGLRTATSISLNSGVLVADASYHLIPDENQTGLYTAVQFRPYETGGVFDYRAIPDWFERNLDHPRWQNSDRSSFPNDLVIEGAWGFEDGPDNVTGAPDAVQDACKILAAFKTLRPEAFLSGAKVTESGIFDLSKYPMEVQSFLADWTLTSSWAVGV